MSAKWQKLYRQALQELDPEKVAEACECARHAINDRIMESPPPTLAGTEEREQLREALRELFVHEQKVRNPK